MPKKNFHLSLVGTVGSGQFDHNFVDYCLSQKYAGKPVDVLIDSMGGSVATALSISSAFHNHGKVAVHLRSLCASAATIASMGAARITMEPTAMYLVHRCSALVVEWASLNAEQLAGRIEQLKKQQLDLEKIDDNIAQMYARRCKKPAADLLALMQKGGWLTAEETLAWGFIDEIAECGDAAKPVLTDSIAATLASAGIPIPNIPTAEKEGSAFTRFLSSLQSFFSSGQQQTNNVKPMNTPEVCKIAGLTSIAADENGNVALTATSLNAVEARIVELNCSADSLRNERDHLQAQVEKLHNDLVSAQEQISAFNKKPGAEPFQVVNDRNKASGEPKSLMQEMLEAEAAALQTVKNWK